MVSGCPLAGRGDRYAARPVLAARGTPGVDADGAMGGLEKGLALERVGGWAVITNAATERRGKERACRLTYD